MATPLHRRVLALAGALIVAAAFAPLSALAATPGAGFAVRPGSFNPNDPATRAYFKPTIAPGKAFTNTVVVTNTGSAPLQVYVYAVDGLTGVTSGAVYSARREATHEAGSWLTVAQPALTVAPRSQRRVGFTVRVPASAQPGDHLAGVAIEDAHPQHYSGRFSVTEVLRMVVGVDIRVPGPAQPHGVLHSIGLRALPGTKFASVVVGLANQGRLLCKPRLSVTVKNPNGSSRTVARQLDTVLPGDSIPYPFAWPGTLAPGTYGVSVVARGCGGPNQLHGSVGLGKTLVGVGTPAKAAPNNNGKSIGLWIVAVALGLGLIGGLGGAVVVTRRARRVPELPWARFSPEQLAALAAATKEAEALPVGAPGVPHRNGGPHNGGPQNGGPGALGHNGGHAASDEPSTH